MPYRSILDNFSLFCASRRRKLHPRIDFLKQFGLNSNDIFRFLIKAPLFLSMSFEGNLAYKLVFLVKIGYENRTKGLAMAMGAVTRTSCKNMQESRYSEPQFTDEFDFEAMNEKFKKDEVWGHLGAPKQWDKAEGVNYNAVGQNLGEEGVYGSVPKFDPKPAYNKDEFFDTISCNSIARGGHNRFSERMRADTETFGNFQQRPHLGYGGYGVGRGESYRGSFNWGRGYNYGGRGHGGHFRI